MDVDPDAEEGSVALSLSLQELGPEAGEVRGGVLDVLDERAGK